jgi:hypothetical protein
MTCTPTWASSVQKRGIGIFRARPHNGAFRVADSVAFGCTDCDAEGLEEVLSGVSNRASAFVEKVSGGRLGCP